MPKTLLVWLLDPGGKRLMGQYWQYADAIKHAKEIWKSCDKESSIVYAINSATNWVFWREPYD